MFLFTQRVLFALCFLSLVGCFPSPCRQWLFQEVGTNYPCFNGGRLTLSPETDFSHIELEIIRNRSGIRFFINLLFLNAIPCQEDPTRAIIEIQFFDQGDIWKVYPFLLEGHQRLLLPGDVADILIESLLNDKPFIIRIEGQEMNVISQNFSLSYHALLNIPILEN